MRFFPSLRFPQPLAGAPSWSEHALCVLLVVLYFEQCNRDPVPPPSVQPPVSSAMHSCVADRGKQVKSGSPYIGSIPDETKLCRQKLCGSLDLFLLLLLLLPPGREGSSACHILANTTILTVQMQVQADETGVLCWTPMFNFVAIIVILVSIPSLEYGARKVMAICPTIRE